MRVQQLHYIAGSRVGCHRLDARDEREYEWRAAAAARAAERLG